MTWELSLTGLAIGLLVGLTGMGGGALLTPFLILFFGFKPTLASGPTSSTAPASRRSAPSATAGSEPSTRG
jgi:uncharacterized membrane protein YfcA